MTDEELIQQMIRGTLFRWNKYCSDMHAEPDDYIVFDNNHDEMDRLFNLFEYIIQDLGNIITTEQIRQYIEDKGLAQ